MHSSKCDYSLFDFCIVFFVGIENFLDFCYEFRWPRKYCKIISFEKIDKKWLVTDLEENRTGAAPVGSTEESAETAVTSPEYASTSSTETEYASEDMTGAEYASTEEAAEETETDEGSTTGGTAQEAAGEEPEGEEDDESGENS